VNESFDREFLAAICAGRARDFIRDWSAQRVEQAAGNGAQEIRNWLLIAGLTGDRPGQLLGYTPVGAWLTGVAVVQFDGGVN
jgi:2,3-dihydroxyphenylpropionate 1,2-dioxygenase